MTGYEKLSLVPYDGILKKQGDHVIWKYHEYLNEIVLIKNLSVFTLFHT